MLVENETLRIRDFTQDDVPMAHQLFSNPTVMQHIEAVFSYEKTEEFIAKHGLNDNPSVFAVDWRHHTFIGYVIFKPYTDVTCYEIGWLLLEAYWHKGYATQLTQMLVDYAKTIGVQSLVIEFDRAQKSSEAIALKFGFQFSHDDDNLVVYKKSLL